MSGLGLGLGLGLGAHRKVGGVKLDPATVEYIANVTDGSQPGGEGAVINVSAVDAIYRKIAEMNLAGNIIHCVSHFAGIRLRVDGATSYVNKLYDLAATNHYLQGEATRQPILNETGIKFDGSNDCLISDFGYNYAQPVTIISKLFTAAHHENDIVASLKNTAPLVDEDTDGHRAVRYGICLGGGEYGYFVVGTRGPAYSTKKTITTDIRELMSNKVSIFTYVNSSPFFYVNGSGDYATGNGPGLVVGVNVTSFGEADGGSFSGSVQGFAVFNKVLSQSEIVAFSEVL